MLTLETYHTVSFPDSLIWWLSYCFSIILFFLNSEYMSGGSVYDYLHKQRGTFKLPSLLKAAIDISKGMNYLHQNNIIHRDLKAANLLMDENEVRQPTVFFVPIVWNKFSYLEFYQWFFVSSSLRFFVYLSQYTLILPHPFCEFR